MLFQATAIFGKKAGIGLKISAVAKIITAAPASFREKPLPSCVTRLPRCPPSAKRPFPDL
jgi:hypothetical protein